MRSWGGVPREIFITYSPMGRLSLTGLWKSVLDISKRALRRSDRSIEAASRSEWLALVLSGESGWSLWINSVRSTFTWKHKNQQLIIIHTRLVTSTMINSHKEDYEGSHFPLKPTKVIHTRNLCHRGRNVILSFTLRGKVVVILNIRLTDLGMNSRMKEYICIDITFADEKQALLLLASHESVDILCANGESQLDPVLLEFPTTLARSDQVRVLISIQSS
jgi:hypothetical protein